MLFINTNFFLSVWGLFYLKVDTLKIKIKNNFSTFKL